MSTPEPMEISTMEIQPGEVPGLERVDERVVNVVIRSMGTLPPSGELSVAGFVALVHGVQVDTMLTLADQLLEEALEAEATNVDKAAWYRDVAGYLERSVKRIELADEAEAKAAQEASDGEA